MTPTSLRIRAALLLALISHSVDFRLASSPTARAWLRPLWNPVPKMPSKMAFLKESLLLLFFRKEVGYGAKPQKKFLTKLKRLLYCGRFFTVCKESIMYKSF
jgi:hypothetical protein